MKGTRNRDLIENLLLLKSLLLIRSAQVEFVVEVQMFQLYRDALEDLLKEKTDRKKKKKGDEDDDMKEKPTGLKITLAGKSYCSFLKSSYLFDICLLLSLQSTALLAWCRSTEQRC